MEGSRLVALPTGYKVGRYTLNAVLGEGGVTPRAVHRDAEQRGPVASKLREDFVVQRHLVAAHRAPVRWIEREDDGLSAEVGQRQLAKHVKQ